MKVGAQWLLMIVAGSRCGLEGESSGSFRQAWATFSQHCTMVIFFDQAPADIIIDYVDLARA